jgi:hypothetical protein
MATPDNICIGLVHFKTIFSAETALPNEILPTKSWMIWQSSFREEDF